MINLKNIVLKSFVVLLFFSHYFVVHAASEKMDAALTITGTTKVSAEDIFSLVDDIPDIVIIDARIRSDRTQGYLESSVSLPDVETTCASLKKHIPGKTSHVLFYCNGVKCGRSGNAAKIAVNCGYNNVYWFRGGFEEWKSKNLPYIKINK